MEKASGSGYIVLFITSINFTVHLYKDMEEAEVENTLLDFIMSSEFDSVWLPLFLLRLINRARRFLLPFFTVYSAAAIILFNLLALIFILEADNLI